jgi:hypothetical protein
MEVIGGLGGIISTTVFKSTLLSVWTLLIRIDPCNTYSINTSSIIAKPDYALTGFKNNVKSLKYKMLD